jgi:hypothetical protein
MAGVTDGVQLRKANYKINRKGPHEMGLFHLFSVEIIYLRTLLLLLP